MQLLPFVACNLSHTDLGLTMQFELNLDGKMVLIDSEDWRKISQFPQYEASTMGRFRNTATNKIMGGTVSHNGYLHVGFMVSKKQTTKLSHRIIAETFLEQPSAAHCVVNHKNKVRTDNRLSNLEWMTRSENAKHAWAK